MPLPRAVPVALACQLPAATGIPLSRWTGPELLAEVIRAETDGELSASSVLVTTKMRLALLRKGGLCLGEIVCRLDDRHVR
jgi:hypothetical protein